MDGCDVLIVGGGPAGSACAWKLRRHGLDVIVLDKAVFPRDKVCAGWITPGVVASLELDIRAYADGRVLQPVTGFRTGLIDGSQVETRYGGPVSFGIRRCEFDHYLLQRSGARLRLGEPLKTLERRGEGWVVNGGIQAALVLGAGGHFCPVARFLGAQLGGEPRTIAAKEIEFAMTPEEQAECRVRPDTPEVYFCRDLRGYGWCVRKGEYLNVGLGREGSRGLGEHLRAFCGSLKQRGRIPSSMPDAFRGHAYLLHGHAARKRVADAMLLIGDAAGLAYAQSGEGIRPAVESGLMAAATILEADGDYGAGKLSSYPTRLSARFGTESASSAGIVPESVRKHVGRALLGSRWFTRHVVLDRWFLRAHDPALQAE